MVREFWTPAEIARRLSVHVFTVRRLIWNGKLRATRVGSVLRVSEAELQRYLERQASATPPDRAPVAADASAPPYVFFGPDR